MPHREPQHYGIHPLQDIRAFPRPEHKVLVHTLLHAGEHIMIIGTAGIGKSIFALQMAMCLSSKQDFLDKFEIPRAVPVMYLQTEGAMTMNVERIEQMSCVEVIKENFYLGVLPSIALNTQNGMGEFRRRYDIHLQNGGKVPAVIFVDSVYSAFQGTVNDDEIVKEFCNSIKAISGWCHGAAFVLVHHEHKQRLDFRGNPQHEGGAQSVMGSTIWNNHIDTGFRIQNQAAHGQKVLTCWKDRNGHIPRELQDEAQGFRMHLVNEPLMYVPSSNGNTESVERLLAFINNHYITSGQLHGCTIEEMATAVGSRNTVNVALRVLKALHKIERSNPGEYPALYRPIGGTEVT